MSRRFLFLFALLVPVVPSAAQSTWPGAPVNTAGFRLAKAIITGDNAPDLATFSAVATGRFAASPRLTVEVELPFARASEEVGFTPRTISGNAMGNPYLGIEVPIASGIVQAGVRLPLGPQPDEEGELAAQLYAFFSEFDRYEAHMAKTTAARVVATFGRLPESGQFAQLRIGATAMKPSGSDTELFADYGGRLGFREGALMGHFGILGRALLSSEQGSIADRTIHMVTAGVAGASGPVRPQAEVRYFLDEGFDDARLVVAIGVAIGW